MNTLSFFVPFPPSVNSAYATVMKRSKAVRVLTQAVKAFKEQAGWAALAAANKQQWRYHSGMRLEIALTVYFPSQRRYDLDNTIKVTQDAIAAALGFDDRREVVRRISAEDGGIDKLNPRCEIEISVTGLENAKML